MTTFDAYFNGVKLNKGDAFGNGWVFDRVEGEIIITHSAEHNSYMRHEPANIGCQLRKLVRVVDVTPTWRAILPIMLLGYSEGNDEARKIALEEFQRMADAADAYNVSVK